MQNETPLLNGVPRIDPGAHLAEQTVKREWIEGSGIKEHLYLLNCYVSSSPEFLTEKTGWGIKAPPAQLIKSKARVNRFGADISRGYWYSYRYDWQRGGLDNEHGQFKTLAKTQDKDGKRVKYLSIAGSDSAAYTQRVSIADVEKAIARAGVALPDGTPELTEENCTQIYWHWALSHPRVPVVVTEGVKKACCLIGEGIPCIALPGVNNIWQSANKSAVKSLLKDLQLLRTEGKPVYLAFDSDILDKAPVRAALKVLGDELLKPLTDKLTGPDLRVLLWSPDQGKGIDDFYVAQGAEKVHALLDNAIAFGVWLEDATDLDWFPKTLYQVIEKKHKRYFAVIGEGDKARFFLWDSDSGVYQPCARASAIVSKILDSVQSPKGAEEKGEFTGAGKPTVINEMLTCIKQRRVVDPGQLDPAGCWCTPAGVLTLKIEKDFSGKYSVDTELAPHSPYKGNAGDRIFTQRTLWNYQPGVEQAKIVQLAEFFAFIPEDYQECFFDYLSCSLDMGAARSRLNRTDIPTLLLTGQGSNGKDTLRILLELVYALRVSNIGLPAIKHHDKDANKFGLNGMDERTAVNFSSENPSVDISRMETFKRLATADPVVVADKGKDQRSIIINALQIHATNRQLHLSNPQVSILSRLQAMTLPFSFLSKKLIDSRPEDQRANLKVARPEFQDRKWLNENIVPAFFNLLLARFEVVLNRGEIDWSPVAHEIQNMIAGSDHVRAFLSSPHVKITEDSGDFVSSAELYGLYTRYVVDSQRAVLVGEMSGKPSVEEAVKTCAEAKYDPLCSNSTALGTRVKSLLKREPTRRRFAGKQVRGFDGLVAGSIS